MTTEEMRAELDRLESTYSNSIAPESVASLAADGKAGGGEVLRQTKIDRAALLAYEELNPTASLREIGERFGVSHEAVRLILAQEGRPTRRWQRPVSDVKPERPRNNGRIYSGNLYYLSSIVRKWLAEIAHGYCQACYGAYPLPEMVKRKSRNPITCKACARAYWHGVARPIKSLSKPQSKTRVRGN